MTTPFDQKPEKICRSDLGASYRFLHARPRLRRALAAAFLILGLALWAQVGQGGGDTKALLTGVFAWVAALAVLACGYQRRGGDSG